MFMKKRAAGAIFLDVGPKFIDFMKNLCWFYFKQTTERIRTDVGKPEGK